MTSYTIALLFALAISNSSSATPSTASSMQPRITSAPAASAQTLLSPDTPRSTIAAAPELSGMHIEISRSLAGLFLATLGTLSLLTIVVGYATCITTPGSRLPATGLAGIASGTVGLSITIFMAILTP